MILASAVDFLAVGFLAVDFLALDLRVAPFFGLAFSTIGSSTKAARGGKVKTRDWGQPSWGTSSVFSWCSMV